MRIIADNETGYVRRWAEAMLQTRFMPPLAVFGIADRFDRIRGAAVFNDFCDRNIELTCIGRGAFTRDVCRELARIVFDVNGCERITIRTRKSNMAIIAMALKHGWKIEGILRRWYGDDDAVVMGMLRDECRWRPKAN